MVSYQLSLARLPLRARELRLTFHEAFFHCTSCHSQEVARRHLKLDYLGIVLNITSTCISSTYFGFYGNKLLQTFYVSLIVACGIATFWVVLDPQIDGNSGASLR